MERDAIVWVSTEFKDDIEALTSQEGMDALVRKYLDESKKDIAADLDALNENVAIYKGLLAEYRQSFRIATEESAQKAYEVWEELSAKDPTWEKVKEAKAKLCPVKQQLDEIDTALNRINLYQIERFLDIVERLSQLDPDMQELLGNLLKTSSVE